MLRSTVEGFMAVRKVSVMGLRGSTSFWPRSGEELMTKGARQGRRRSFSCGGAALRAVRRKKESISVISVKTIRKPSKQLRATIRAATRFFILAPSQKAKLARAEPALAIQIYQTRRVWASLREMIMGHIKGKLAANNLELLNLSGLAPQSTLTLITFSLLHNSACWFESVSFQL